ncbi:putative membrane protein [Variovorax boronicumulans]|uniref:Membrane protein n=1 Tax=Variovorax boronicumulans TaxID=436515 RepID=A0AAW8D1Y1_9BURK|nr:DUF4149 domain-containing protein [Variovorax boronicumulans]MDP9893982.1 putative membrane protein [Variovorax boronicumulans]MDQ0053799.1 putative membrane protein [Variovorax boronicumulans]
MKDRLALLLAAFWWGSLTTIGFLVVPMLFAKLGNPAVAGNFAGQLFEAQSWVAIGCGLILLIHFRSKADERMDAATMTSIGLVLGALLLALLQQYAVAPRILARENLKLWHTVGSGMYVAQWLCTLVLLWRMGARPGR